MKGRQEWMWVLQKYGQYLEKFVRRGRERVDFGDRANKFRNGYGVTERLNSVEIIALCV